ncbi:HAD family hydrolase [Streptomyces sp. TRM 70351]|uniref:HAD family hydrolase n=1 Tax=Streptomyces sp. TRM 70351 TaxID=3116552 RepID=UPI002E7B0572|nr:HAD family hydrolase [Streptomyces sp. TRM 70351]MEE1929844.1 HAD family hydrolase [Streptomyces sp. TRM 70351]
MTGDRRDLVTALAPVRHVLLDFDGPVCSIFAGLPAPAVAQLLLGDLRRARGPVPDAWAQESDPLAFLRRIAEEAPELTALADEVLTQLEVEAAQSARPTPGAEAALMACAASGRAVHAVSNNSTAAIAAYLDAHGLRGLFASVVGRVPGVPQSMKPSPRLLIAAMADADAKRPECMFVGDAVRDVEAATAAGIPTIGYANKKGKRESLTAAGAVVIIDHMESVASALTSPGPPGD